MGDVWARASVNTPSVSVYRQLAELMGDTEKIHLDAAHRVSMAPDASHYIFVPEAVVIAETTTDVSRVLAFASMHNIGITFRSGGTSLSGQSGAPGILVDTRRAFREIEILDQGRRVRVQPGATIRAVNALLYPFGRSLGPDPASEVAATIGGVIANNSSGMACGTAHNSYSTLESLVFTLPSGTVVDSSAPDANEDLRRREPELFEGLIELRKRIVSSPDLVNELRRQYAIKNTMGYGLNSFLDYQTPVDILTHLMVGSEGTLGFISSAVFSTVPILPKAATGFALFPSLHDATASVPALKDSGARTVELLDSAAVRVVKDHPSLATLLGESELRDQAVLLIEYQEETEAALAQQLKRAAAAIASTGGTGFEPTDDAAERAQMWKMRKGLYTTVAGARKSGTTALLEDVGVPVEYLADACEDLQSLFSNYGYNDAVIFGHAKDGNIHFLITEDFSSHTGITRFEAFTANMVEVVLKYGGTLKAEHGTGRIMAPFVERQFGSELYSIMTTIKTLVDPRGILNPEVLVNNRPGSHVENFKQTPTVEAEVDRCVECGYCEPICPSKDLTLTPRQRIALRRARESAKVAGNYALDEVLAREEEYQSIQTCAVDGLCQTLCPLGINTADLVRELRSREVSPVLQTGWDVAAKQWATVTEGAAVAMTVAKKVPLAARWGTTLGRTIVSPDILPQWTPDLPSGGSRRRGNGEDAGNAAAVLFSACVGTMFASAEGEEGVAAALRSLCDGVGLELVIPDGIEKLCCGTPWKSKGLERGYRRMVRRVVTSLEKASDNGRLPIVCDNSSCTEGLLVAVGKENPDLQIVDAVEFVRQRILPHLDVSPTIQRLVLHPTCGSTRLGINDDLVAIAQRVAHTVDIPSAWGCCAFAGDRGMLHPELTASATAREAAEVRAGNYDAHASCNRTCEMGMSRATGKKYGHVIELLAAAVSSGESHPHECTTLH